MSYNQGEIILTNETKLESNNQGCCDSVLCMWMLQQHESISWAAV